MRAASSDAAWSDPYGMSLLAIVPHVFSRRGLPIAGARSALAGMVSVLAGRDDSLQAAFQQWVSGGALRPPSWRVSLGTARPFAPPSSSDDEDDEEDDPCEARSMDVARTLSLVGVPHAWTVPPYSGMERRLAREFAASSAAYSDFIAEPAAPGATRATASGIETAVLRGLWGNSTTAEWSPISTGRAVGCEENGGRVTTSSDSRLSCTFVCEQLPTAMRVAISRSKSFLAISGSESLLDVWSFVPLFRRTGGAGREQ